MTLLIDRLKSIINSQIGKPGLFVRTLIKEPVQDYILSFVYNSSKYKQCIFTGGTALRKLYGLPRHSEDIDFDLVKPIQTKVFAKDVTDYIAKTLQYKEVVTKVSGSEQTVFLKFPRILSEIGFTKSESESQQLIIRCDFSVNKLKDYQTEVRPINIEDSSFFVEVYDLPTLFANKINAFLKRTFFRGNAQTMSFKGRDLFDLVWLFEQSIQSNFKIQPNWKRIFQETGINNQKEILEQILTKTRRIKQKDVSNDLTSFLEPGTVQSFGENFLTTITSQINHFEKQIQIPQTPS